MPSCDSAVTRSNSSKSLRTRSVFRPLFFYRLTLGLPSWASHSQILSTSGLAHPRLFSSTPAWSKKSKIKPRKTAKSWEATMSAASTTTSDVGTTTVATNTAQSSEDSDLIAAIHALSAKSPKLVRSSVYPAPADASIQVRSWKMNEFKYYDIPSPFPTLARGLFTREIPDDVQEEDEKTARAGKRYAIVIRGYDKFFNIGEVPWTTVS